MAKQLGDRLLDKLRASNVTGRVREPVMTHSATQHIALSEGATMVGAYLNLLPPVQQVGITDGLVPTRMSVSVAYSPLKELSPATVWIPGPYDPMVRAVIQAGEWPRDFGVISRNDPRPDRPSISTVYDSLNRIGIVEVQMVGEDLIDVVDGALAQLESSGAEYIGVRLPANQPALASIGAGLVDLELAYASLVPALWPSTPDNPGGDVLFTQWVASPEYDTSDWVFANETVEELVLALARQSIDLRSRKLERQRRTARRAQLFAALDF